MRKFSTDAPEFFAFQIEGSKKVYKIPLATSMTNEELFAFEDTNGEYRKQVEWLSKYMGDAVNHITAGETGNIIKAWAEESKDQGATTGES